MKRARLLLSATTLAIVTAEALWLARPELAELVAEPAASPPAALEAPALIERGRYLARAGNCIACHTQAGQPAYAGGREIVTPFGSVFSSNLTPDPETGLGTWNADDFWRAMHYGKSRDGRRLSPAFPYTNYTLVTRADADAIFAYLRTLPAVRSPRIDASMRFPFDTQLALLAWRAMYFRPGEFAADPQRDAAWNRGAYLVEGLGHCNACHTTRTALGGLDSAAAYAGGPIPMLGWDALPLAREAPLSPDDAAALRSLLKTGTSRAAVASGPMAEVVFFSTQYLETDDVDAMLRYIGTLPAHASQPRGLRVSEREKQALLEAGAPLYREHCASCHGDRGEGQGERYPALAGNRVALADSPRNAILAVVNGGFGPSTAGNPQPFGMPPFGHRLSDREIAAVLSHVRNAWGNAAPAVSEREIERR
ncbi:MAG TPA: cytochrome c [Fontimonas sp.]